MFLGIIIFTAITLIIALLLKKYILVNTIRLRMLESMMAFAEKYDDVEKFVIEFNKLPYHNKIKMTMEDSKLSNILETHIVIDDYVKEMLKTINSNLIYFSPNPQKWMKNKLIKYVDYISAVDIDDYTEYLSKILAKAGGAE